MKAFALLKQYDIPTGMMFTVTKHNREDLIPIMNLAAGMGHRSFAFDTVSPVSPADECRELMLTPLEFRATYKEYLEEARRLGQQGCETVFARKNHLYALIMEEEGRLNMIESDQMTYFLGCPIGKGLIINSEGTVLSCPRIPIAIGHVPEEEILDILLYSDLLTRFRDRANHHACGSCSLFQYCRGCRASAWGVSGDFFGVDPYCWKERRPQRGEGVPAMLDSAQSGRPSEGNGYENAREIMSIYYGWDYEARPKYDPQLQEILGRALRDVEFRQRLSVDAAKACDDYDYKVSDIILFELGRIEFDSFFDLLGSVGGES
jgi:radical SAM protein with 4Fe4S-binding SPASM domain